MIPNRTIFVPKLQKMRGIQIGRVAHSFLRRSLQRLPLQQQQLRSIQILTTVGRVIPLKQGVKFANIFVTVLKSYIIFTAVNNFLHTLNGLAFQ